MTEEQAKRLVVAVRAVDPGQRHELLAAMDPGLRKEVETLIASEEGVEPVTVDKSTAIKPLSPDSKTPDRIGPYRMLREIGEGGMGVVYEAEQEKPVRRKVALKLIKWGMDTKAVVARFESERQALALMNHPNIASVFDAGATDEGRPYFAMEYVHGIPITDYCDKHRLTIEERLDLFIHVCDGVQHAHQKGIIHRDIKPSNVLVAVQDDKPVPKIIDFGVAKATSQRLTERTVATELGQLIGTPEYMSPEQAEMTNLDIDTRTDVYSLGVLLYELLVGARPFDSRELRQAGLAEIQRKLRNEDPDKPSTKVNGLGEQSTTSASNRRVAVRTLAIQLKGDLDWITMKTLEKDRTRRYETANALALDVGRYLNDEPIRARAPSTTYRVRKFVTRHKLGAFAGAATFLALAVGVALATYGLLSARRSAEQATREAERASAISSVLQQILTAPNPSEGEGPRMTVKDLLDEAVGEIDGGSLAGQLEVEAEVRSTVGTTYLSLGLFEEADAQFSRALRLRERVFGSVHPSVAESLAQKGRLARAQGDYDEAEGLYHRALEMLGGKNDATASRSDLLNDLALLLYDRGKLDEAEPLFAELVELGRSTRTPESAEDLATTLNNYALFQRANGNRERAEALFREALAILREIHGDKHVYIAAVLDSIGSIKSEEGDFEAAEELMREALGVREQVLGAQDPQVAHSHNGLGLLYYRMKDYGSAELSYGRSLELREELLGLDHPLVASVLNNLGLLYTVTGNPVKAETAYRRSIEIRKRRLGESHPNTLNSQNNYSRLMLSEGRVKEAEALSRTIVERSVSSVADDHWYRSSFVGQWGACLLAMRRFPEAEDKLVLSYEGMLSEFGEGHTRTVEATERLTRLYTAWGKPEKAAEYRALLDEAKN